MKIKRVLCILLSVAMVTCLVGCEKPGDTQIDIEYAPGYEPQPKTQAPLFTSEETKATRGMSPVESNGARNIKDNVDINVTEDVSPDIEKDSPEKLAYYKEHKDDIKMDLTGFSILADSPMMTFGMDVAGNDMSITMGTSADGAKVLGTYTISGKWSYLDMTVTEDGVSGTEKTKARIPDENINDNPAEEFLGEYNITDMFTITNVTSVKTTGTVDTIICDVILNQNDVTSMSVTTNTGDEIKDAILTVDSNTHKFKSLVMDNKEDKAKTTIKTIDKVGVDINPNDYKEVDYEEQSQEFAMIMLAVAFSGLGQAVKDGNLKLGDGVSFSSGSKYDMFGSGSSSKYLDKSSNGQSKYGSTIQKQDVPDYSMGEYDDSDYYDYNYDYDYDDYSSSNNGIVLDDPDLDIGESKIVQHEEMYYLYLFIADNTNLLNKVRDKIQSTGDFRTLTGQEDDTIIIAVESQDKSALVKLKAKLIAEGIIDR